VEVVPFLTLAVGVDNIFILVHSFEETYHTNRDVASRLSMVGRYFLRLLSAISTKEG
jgi:hypothetical protein